MASGPRASRSVSRPFIGWTVAFSLGSLLLVPAAAPATTVTRERARSAATTPTTGAAATKAPASAGCCRVGSAPRTGTGTARRREPASSLVPVSSAPRKPDAQSHGEPAGKAAHPGSGATTLARRHHERNGAGRRAARNAPGSGHGTPKATGGAASGPGPSTTAADRRRGRGSARRGKGAREARHPRRSPQPLPEATPGPAASTPATLASVASAASVASPPTAATTTPIVSRAQPSSRGVSSGAAARGHRAPTGAARAEPLAASPLATATGLAPAPAAVTTAGRGRPASSGAPASRGQSQLVTTVTRIINVIPPLVRFALVALAALALALGVSSRLVALRARRLARQRRQLLDDVGLLQAALLPPIPARLGPVGTSSAYRPASGPGAGGDFYDVFALGDGQLAVIVGDVSGHGREALPQTTLVRFTLRAYLEAGLSPRGALQTAAPVLERQLGESFATVVLATYHPRDRVLTYACAGHPPPAVIGSDRSKIGDAPITACAAPPIGAGRRTGTRQTVVSLPGESLACFYTDGLLDARMGGELFGPARVEQTLVELGSDATASTLIETVAKRCEQHPDDMAACLLRIEGPQRAPRVQVEELELDRRELEHDRVQRFLSAGGLDSREIAAVMRSVSSAIAREGCIVLELHLGAGTPEVRLREQNVTQLAPALRASALREEAVVRSL
jgi:hypothetical protein